MIILHAHDTPIFIVNIFIISLREALSSIWIPKPILRRWFLTDPATSRLIFTCPAVITFLDHAFLDYGCGSFCLATVNVSLTLFTIIDGNLFLGRLDSHLKHLCHYLVCLLITLLRVSCLSLDSLLEASHPLIWAFCILDRSANTWTPSSLCHEVVLLFLM
jgi:hypothetical protein